MTLACKSPLAWETLVDHWAGDLEASQQDAVEEHLMGCASCTELSARVAAVTEAVREMLPPLLTAAQLEKLARKGLRIVENPMLPGERKVVPFPDDADLLIHRLGGLDLTQVERVSFTMHVESSGQLLAQVDDAQFDRDSGAVLLACQKHYAHFPPDTVAEVRTRDASGAETVQRYTILHRF